MAGGSQNSNTYNRRPRHQGPSPTLQLSLLDTATVDDGGEGQQAKHGAVLTAQRPQSSSHESSRSSMADLSPEPIDNSSMDTLLTAEVQSLPQY